MKLKLSSRPLFWAILATAGFVMSLLPALSMGSPYQLQNSEDRPTIILLMVDGVRPDVVEQMMSYGELPNIKRYFLDSGTYMENSFTPMSLTVPSWSTILTGMDIDRTGIKGNDVFDRSTKTIENFLDVRKEIIFDQYRRHGRAYRTVREAGIPLLMDRMNRGQGRDAEGYVLDEFGNESDVFMTIFPLTDTFPLYLLGTLPDNLTDIDLWKTFSAHDAVMRLLFDYSAASALDRDNLDQALKVFSDARGRKKKLIGIYLQTVDTLSHHEHIRGRRSLREVDYQIGKVLQAMQGSRYKDSIVALVSDHGSLGGEEYKIDNEYNPLRGETYALTMTNMSQLFSGWYNRPGFADYHMNVEAALAAEGKFSLKNLTEIQLQPFQCTNVARVLSKQYDTCMSFHDKHPDQIHAAVASNQTISLPYASFDSQNWKTPNNWYTLTHYTVNRNSSGTPTVRNLIQDLENFRLENLLVFNSDLAAKIGNQPLDWLAITLDKNQINPALAKLVGAASEEDVILIHKSSESEALILRARDGRGQTLFRYIPIQNFEQDAQGRISFIPGAPSDPLLYLGNPWAERSANGAQIEDNPWLSTFHTDREWTGRYARTAYPNTVPALTRFMSFRGKLERKKEKLRADIYLNPRYGHYFSIGNETYEVTHGMWQRESVRNLFMLRGPGVQQGLRVRSPVFTTDIAPTALRAAGYSSDTRYSGEEFWRQFDGRPVIEALH